MWYAKLIEIGRSIVVHLKKCVGLRFLNILLLTQSKTLQYRLVQS